MSILILGDHHYGHGEDLTAAKKKFREFGGALGDGYTIVDFGDKLVYSHVDDFGGVHWLAGSGEGDVEPTSTDVKPRRKR